MAAATGTGWAQLRQQTRSLETQTESLFHTYSQFASASKPTPKPSDEEQRVDKQIQDLLQKRESLTTQLSRLLDSETPPGSSTLKQNNLLRHREILSEHRRELSRIRSLISDSRDRANLLSNVRSDIDAYRTNNPEEVEAEYMLDERSRIDNSHNMVDSVLSQAYAVNENFGLQRETLANINRRIVGAASQVPGINTLIGKIGTRKRRDGVIMGVLVAFCFLMVLWLR